MFRGRRWLAGVLVVVFAAVEVFASAPQLHLHSQALAQMALLQHGRTITTPSSRTAPPSDCIACRAFSIATTLISWIGVTPPGAHQALTLVTPALFPASVFHDDARGRAPPAC
jgi:hypothetical protein